ncbi:hypothetical protein [Prevotella sp.]|nr:hypothetical protein [Prevotella sp.]
MMDSLYFIQFACFIFMLINALILGVTHLHMKWANRRYEWSRWLILAGMLGPQVSLPGTLSQTQSTLVSITNTFFIIFYH